MQVAVEKATVSARTELAQQISTRLGNLTKSFQEEVGLQDDSALLMQFTSATKAVVDETLVGSRTEKQELQAEGDIYRAYVLMTLPLSVLLVRDMSGREAMFCGCSLTRGRL